MRNENIELKNAIYIVWYVISVILLVILVLALLNPPRLLNEIPLCEYKLEGKECCFCGMTRAFFAIGNMNFQIAQRLNSGSVLLFIMFLLNTIIITINFFKKQLIKIKS